MTANTKNLLRAIFAGDATITDEQGKGAFCVLEGKGATPEPMPRLYTAGEVARLTRRTTKCVRDWAKRGYLVPVKLPGMARGRGYTEASVRALLEGRPQGAPVAPCGGVADGAGAVA